MRDAKEAMFEGSVLVLVLVLLFSCCCCFFVASLQQGGFGDGIAVVIVGMAVGFSSRLAELIESCLSTFEVLERSVDGRASRSQQHGPRDLSHWHPVPFAVSDDSVKASSQVTNILILTSMPEAWSRAKAPDSSSDIQEVQELFLTTQMNSKRRMGSRWDEARCAMSRSWGRMKVTPVEPAIRRAVSKAAKSAWEPPYGPSIRAMCICWAVVNMASCWVLGKSVAVDKFADVRRRFVKPLCDFRMKMRSLLCDEGTDAIVAGWD